MPDKPIIYKAVEITNTRGRRFVVQYVTTIEGAPHTGVRGRPYETLEAAARRADELNAFVASYTRGAK